MSRTIVLTENALSELHTQVEYLQSVHAPLAATRLIDRFDDFTAFHLALYPDTGRHVPEQDIYEIWILVSRYLASDLFSDMALMIGKWSSMPFGTHLKSVTR